MSSFITISCFLVALGSIAILNIIIYPISKKGSIWVSDIITTVHAPLLFSILAAYKNFKFLGDNDHKKELPSQYLIMSNHQSLLDIPLYMRFLPRIPLRFVAKDELGRHIPLVSEMLRAHEHALIPRTGSPSQAMRVLDSFAERVKKNNWIPVIFPEGTRSKDGSVGNFYAAGFRRLLDKAPMPVAVCALDGGYKISNLEGIMRNLENGSYRVKILKIYPAPTTKAEQVHILEEGKTLIEAQLTAWRSQ